MIGIKKELRITASEMSQLITEAGNQNTNPPTTVDLSFGPGWVAIDPKCKWAIDRLAEIRGVVTS